MFQNSKPDSPIFLNLPNLVINNIQTSTKKL
jgi:hypothetical protein